jgi:phage regulator Rha-like protein
MEKQITHKHDGSLIQISDGEAWTTSLVIAEEFGRPHKNVLRAIDDLIADGTIDRLNFEPADFIDKNGADRQSGPPNPIGG